MLTSQFNAFDLLSTPVWILRPENEEVIFANRAARACMATPSAPIGLLRDGVFSAHAQRDLSAYIPALLARQQVMEVWTIQEEGVPHAMRCRLSLAPLEDGSFALIAEGSRGPALTSPAWRAPAATGPAVFHEQLFRTNAAPMLLIDPEADGRIVDANEAALNFYGYTRDVMCQRHTWEINALGRDVMPIMHEIAQLPGGHRPLNFTHRLANGEMRHVQTYAGPLELDGRRLMLCMIHDVTEQKRLETELEQAALRDPLTGLWNRRQFLHLVDRAQANGRRYGQVFSLILVDADHFKSINDRFGHHVGDELLIVLARILESRIRETDAVCRWGGEEFVVLLPQTPLAGAQQLAESIRQTVQALHHPFLPPVTVSLGVAEHAARDEEAGDIFRRCDEALYRAKENGRNQVCTG